MSQCHDSYEHHSGATTHLPVRVADVMTTDPVTVDPTATVRDIAEIMVRHDIRALPVVDIGDQLVGIVSEADLILREGYPSVRHHGLSVFVHGVPEGELEHRATRSEGLTAEEIMTAPVITCDPGESVAAVARRMMERDLRTLPVLDHGRLVGVVSRHDVLRLFVRPDSEVRDRINRLLGAPVWKSANGVSAEVRDGVVILTGTVAEPVDASVVRSIVRQLPGVVEVVDRVVPRAEIGESALEPAYE